MSMNKLLSMCYVCLVATGNEEEDQGISIYISLLQKNKMKLHYFINIKKTKKRNPYTKAEKMEENKKRMI